MVESKEEVTGTGLQKNADLEISANATEATEERTAVMILYLIQMRLKTLTCQARMNGHLLQEVLK